MSESSDYDPGPWRGHDFKSARAAYDVHVGRSYGDATTKGIKTTDLVPEHLETDSESPLVIALDVTGSMGDWPATIFSKLPYLEHEGKEYLGETMEISFAAVGDCFSDKYPLQVRPFTKGTALKDQLEKLVIEGGGGGSSQESYDLAAVYYAKNAKMPKAIRPIFIFVGDEGLYSTISQDKAATFAKTDLGSKPIPVEALMEELKTRYSVYLIRKLYGSSSGNTMSDADLRIQGQWESMLGADHVVMLPEAGRVVDVIFGILAKETGRIDYFKKELTDRQDADQVDVVMKSLHTVHSKAATKSVKKLPAPGKSITRSKRGPEDSGKATKSLI